MAVVLPGGRAYIPRLTLYLKVALLPPLIRWCPILACSDLERAGYTEPKALYCIDRDSSFLTFRRPAMVNGARHFVIPLINHGEPSDGDCPRHAIRSIRNAGKPIREEDRSPGREDGKLHHSSKVS